MTGIPLGFPHKHFRPIILGSICAALGASACGCGGPKRHENSFAVARPGSLLAPKGSPWTILCLELRGPQGRERMAQIAETFRRTKEIRGGDVVVLDDSGESDGPVRLYYGTYYRRTDPKTGRRSIPDKLRRDLELVKTLGTPDGRHYFFLARKVRVPTPDVGNPAWDLTTIDAAYTLQVAVFEPTDNFWDAKQAAADYCAWLRKRGYEAYYYHAAGSSMVTVGTFGDEALSIPPLGLPRYSSEVLAMQEDELLKYNRLNGKIYRSRNEEGRQVRVGSRLVRTPAFENRQ